jgi:hypothetical protein
MIRDTMDAVALGAQTSRPHDVCHSLAQMNLRGEPNAPCQFAP